MIIQLHREKSAAIKEKSIKKEKERWYLNLLNPFRPNRCQKTESRTVLRQRPTQMEMDCQV